MHKARSIIMPIHLVVCLIITDGRNKNIIIITGICNQLNQFMMNYKQNIVLHI